MLAPELPIPALALVVIASAEIEAARAFAARHFTPAEVVMIAPEAASAEAFQAARGIIARRLRDGQLAAAMVFSDEPTIFAALAHQAHHFDVAPVAVRLGDAIPLARFPAGPHSYAKAYTLAAPEEWTAARVTRRPLACDLRGERGPFDIIGDVHGCYDELLELLAALDYRRAGDAGGWRHPEGRRVIFVGDLVDRGPGVIQVARLAMEMVAAGQGFCAPGNHDNKLMRALDGRHVHIAHGLRETLDQITALPTEEERAAFTLDFKAFVRGLPPYLWLEDGDLVVAHAGLVERYHGRVSERIRALALYGETTGWEDEFGNPERIDWAAEYRGAAAVVYGHTPYHETRWRHNTINVDTGCVHGGRLTAVRWPERDLVSVAARREYAPRAGGLR
jgi:protein phosphatase